MSHTAARTATRERDAGRYQRHRPEQTLLYQIVEAYYPVFTAHLAEWGRELPGYVQHEFEDYLKCGRLEHGFLRFRCDSSHAEHLVAFSCKRRGFCPSCGARRMAESTALLVDEVFPEQPVRQWVLSVPYPLRFLFASRPVVMGQVLGIVYRSFATHLTKQAGFTCKRAQTGAVTLIQRFGSALNLNVHFHMLFLDGVYVERPDGTLHFRWVKALSSAELAQLTQTLALRIGRYLERQGLLERDAENSYLAGDGLEAGSMEQLLGSSITYRITIGRQQGRKVFTLQMLPACATPFADRVGKVAGFSLHAGVAARADERRNLERLCRYISRPAISEQRLSLTPNGNVRYQLKMPYEDGTTHVIFEPPTPAERRASMNYAQRLKRVFNIDIETCHACGGAAKVVACIEDLVVIQKILTHLDPQEPRQCSGRLPQGRRRRPDCSDDASIFPHAVTTQAQQGFVWPDGRDGPARDGSEGGFSMMGAE